MSAIIIAFPRSRRHPDPDIEFLLRFRAAIIANPKMSEPRRHLAIASLTESIADLERGNRELGHG